VSLSIPTRSVPESVLPPVPRGPELDPHDPGAAARSRSRAAHPAGRAHQLPGGLALRFPTAQDVAELARRRHPLSLSVLMATTPAAQMIADDRATLRALALDAERRLLDELDEDEVTAVLIGLAAATARAANSPTDRGVAILVSPQGAHLHHLRVAPRDRVVLDPTFATRDLVRSTVEDPPFLMLVLDGRAARLFHYDQRYSRPVLGHDFPMIAPGDQLRDDPAVGSVARHRLERSRAFLRRIDARLAERSAATGLPVVLVASERLAAEYLAVAGPRRIAAVVPAGSTRLPLDRLEELARASLAQHVSDRAAAALDALRGRMRRGAAVAGLDRAWDAMLRGEPEMLVVERSYSAAVRVSDTGFALAEDPEEPGVIDDAVDELIEAVLLRGADVVTVPDGSLAHHGGLVLVLRGRIPF